MSAQNNRDTGETIMEEKIPGTTEKTEAKKATVNLRLHPLSFSRSVLLILSTASG